MPYNYQFPAVKHHYCINDVNAFCSTINNPLSMKTQTTPKFPLFLLCFSLSTPPLPSIQYGQHSGKESIITKETRASRMNLRSRFKSMCVSACVCVWEIKSRAKLETTEFLGHLTSDKKKPERMKSASCHDTKAPNNNPPTVKRGLRVHMRERPIEKHRMTCDCVCLAFQHPQAVLKKWFNNKDGPGPVGESLGQLTGQSLALLANCCTGTTYYVFFFFLWFVNVLLFN